MARKADITAAATLRRLFPGPRLVPRLMAALNRGRTSVEDDRVKSFAEAFRVKHKRYPTQAEIRAHSGLDIPRATLHRIVHRVGIAA